MTSNSVMSLSVKKLVSFDIHLILFPEDQRNPP